MGNNFKLRNNVIFLLKIKEDFREEIIFVLFLNIVKTIKKFTEDNLIR